MNDINKIYNQEAYSYCNSKSENFSRFINYLTHYHYKNSKYYKNFLDGLKYNFKIENKLSDLPFLPIRLFKEFELLSIKKIYLKYFIHLELPPIICQKFF